MLTCSICGAEDYRILDGFDSNMEPTYSHHIKFDPYLLPDGRQYLLPEEKAQGWLYKVLDGKPVKYRLLCGACLIKQEDTRHTRKVMNDELAKEAERRNLQHNFYSRFLQFE